MKVADGRYGYTVKPGFQSGSVWINEAGFHQKDTVPVRRAPGRLRVVCMGESTTFGNNVNSSYSAFLRAILERHGVQAEVINAGVPGWVSDQVALRAELQLAAYEPDVVILYVGWNDFQSYDPLGPEPAVSYWEFAYKGNKWKQQTTTWLRSVALLSALYHRQDTAEAMPAAAQGAGHYRFLFENLDRIVRAYRDANPNVQVFVSTLAGRWPIGTAEQWEKIVPVWWMTEHDVSITQAASLVQAMNEQIRSYARRANLHLIDAAAAFEPVDRARLFTDWAHMISDGYELLAWTMFEAMVREQVVRVTADLQRAETLKSTYALTHPVVSALQPEAQE
jgi:lysophospholipase L1-like esterase